MEHFGLRIAKSRANIRISRESYIQVSQRCTLCSYGEAKYMISRGAKHLLLDEMTQTVRYTDAHCELLQRRALQNYDLNMAYFDTLDDAEFHEELARFTKNRRFVEAADLCSEAFADPYERGIDGYLYIMVLGQYKQVYIGMTTMSLKKRIQQHWNKRKELDRLVYGNVEKSRISIDSFGPLDTTQIYAKAFVGKKLGDLELTEERYIRAFDSKFVLNRL